jgi:hypothetical protein
MSALAVSAALRTRPLCRLGAASPGGLALPDAHPSPTTLYAPRGVFINSRRIVAVDSGNHRVLIWNRMPYEDGEPADVVLGQPGFTSEGARAAGRGPEAGFHLPTAALVVAGTLLVADAWHHRIVVWSSVPTRSDTPPDYVIGQPDPRSIEPNRGGTVDADSLYWPYGLAWIDGILWVADTGNRRVLGWHGLPTEDRPADFVLGQPSLRDNAENRGGPLAADSFRWPHAIAGGGGGSAFYVADAGTHRVLGWNEPPAGDRPADFVLGQSSFTVGTESQYAPQSATTLRFPYGAAVSKRGLAVADTANNRILVWPGQPTSTAAPAELVLGQNDFRGNGENRWKEITADTLCWPYGISWRDGFLAVADSGNNRVMIWELDEA